MANQRDALITTCGGQRIVITADNSAGIGHAKLDQVQVDPYLVGLLTARVALLEAIALGADPVAISSTLSFDHQSSDGQRIHKGILAAAATIGLGPEQITGSSETNFPAEITCLGVTAVSAVAREQLLLGRVKPGDACWLLGRPRVGAEVVAAHGGLPTLPLVKSLTSWPLVQEIMPVGSQGIRWELTQLAGRSSLRWQAEPMGGSFPWRKSAGPATCVIVCGQLDPEQLAAHTGQPVILLGHFVEKGAELWPI